MRFAMLALLLFAVNVHAQHQHQPYAGQQAREVKSLSDEEAKQYLSGAGMGFARSAELNRYPGPMHVLELADQLKLTAGQRSATRALMDSHKAEARAIGAKLVESERNLDKLFREGGVDAAKLSDTVQASARLQGEYRLAHLETHRRMRALLTDEQVQRYDALRGYK